MHTIVHLVHANNLSISLFILHCYQILWVKVVRRGEGETKALPDLSISTASRGNGNVQRRTSEELSSRRSTLLPFALLLSIVLLPVL